MDVGVTGSIAFDHLMSFEGRFEDHILADKIHSLNVSFLVNSFERRRGGCAANIAYACARHSVDVGLIGAVGHDFGDYAAWLSKHGVDLSAVTTYEELHTASCFITTDRSANQITGFYPGAMAKAAELSLKADSMPKPKYLVIAPNDLGAMTLYPTECRDLEINYLYDPGQQVIALDRDQLLDGLRGAAILIANDYELATIQKKLEISKVEDLLESCQMLIVTYGDQGSEVFTRENSVGLKIPVAPVSSVQDPTGCGDAYRGGFLAGLLANVPLEICGRMGALTAAYCAEVKGTNEYDFSKDEFASRYRDAFGEELRLN